MNIFYFHQKKLRESKNLLKILYIGQFEELFNIIILNVYCLLTLIIMFIKLIFYS